MNATNIREQLHGYLEIADDKKVKAIYTMVEDEIRETIIEYTPEYKRELDNRANDYLNGGKMVSPDEMKKRLQSVRKKRK